MEWTKAFIFKADQTIVDYPPANGDLYTLQELQDAVGGYIEILRTDWDSLVVVNEDGHRLELAHNVEASRLCGRLIVGDVLICPKEWID